MRSGVAKTEVVDDRELKEGFSTWRRMKSFPSQIRGRIHEEEVNGCLENSVLRVMIKIRMRLTSWRNRKEMPYIKN